MNKVEENYWGNIYNTNSIITSPSNFAYFIQDYFKNDKLNILDCGCGNGRDSYYFSNYNIVHGIDSSFIPKNKKNCTFEKADFCKYNKYKYDLIYSRFTFHSITNEQQETFLKSINSNTYLCIETRSDKSKNIEKIFGDNHFRNYTNKNYLLNLLKKYNFDILYIEEKKDFAKYKNENPICIRVICKKI